MVRDLPQIAAKFEQGRIPMIPQFSDVRLDGRYVGAQLREVAERVRGKHAEKLRGQNE